MFNMFIGVVIGLAIAGVVIWTDRNSMNESINSFNDEEWN